ncbi:cation transport ATPase [Frankia casuarinae]|uniref:ATPase, E1-E2 type n=2 Tax=Frankia casuarinae (strain DSM 45818 / CECT 9043 / HFP020203 / CcI3) TaxID=106370 RepID=Q2JG56_FRACC|nr:cation-transporting P-type ATPase [Frankia casuarinae]ABD09736.1 ATPase, E1-E2 type [Frankia casuarinae]EYT92979.1 cation transport ATPase [Frankia casuarinae]
MRLPAARTVLRVPSALLGAVAQPVLAHTVLAHTRTGWSPDSKPGSLAPGPPTPRGVDRDGADRDGADREIAGSTAAGEPRGRADAHHLLSLGIRGISGPAGESRRRQLERVLENQPGVAWARVNEPLQCVLIGLAEPPPTLDDLVAALGRVEGVALEPKPGAVARFAAPVRRTAAALAADGVAFALASAGRLARAVPLPIEIASLVTLVDTQPRLRRWVEQMLGAGRADVVLGLVNAGALALAQGNLGLAVDAGYRMVALGEARARRDAFMTARDGLLGHPDWAAAEPVVTERPRPLPDGPVERYADLAVLGGLGGFAAATAATGNPRRAVALAATSLPRPARVGREGFAAQLTRVLARRGVHVMDSAALRVLDRVDTIVIDADVLRGEERIIADVVPLAGANRSDVAVRAHALFRPAGISAVATAEGWALGPVEQLGLRGRTGVRERRELARSGADTVLGLAQGSRLMAIVSVEPGRAEGSHHLLAACRRSGRAVFIAGDPPAGAGGTVEDTNNLPGVPGGDRLVGTIRGLQAERGGVLVVSRRRAAVGTADCGVGVNGHDGSPAWGAHILVGNDLAAASLVIEAVAAAAQVSRHAVRLAQVGSGAGALAMLTGADPRLVSRAMTMVTAAVTAALGEGIWAARELGRRPPPPAVPRTPWHILPAEDCLALLDNSRPGGLSTEEAARRRQDGAVSMQATAPSLVRAFAAELANPLTPVLLGGAALSAATGSVLDAGLVLSVAIGSAFAGAVQQIRADRALARLFAVSAVPARVLRDGEETKLPADDLVPGDIIMVGAGDVVPADCRLLSTTGLDVDESSLTGESMPVTKSPGPVAAANLADRSSMIYEGTTVAGGRGAGVVVATGSATEAGRSMAATAGPARLSGVEARLSTITDLTIPVALAAAGALLASGLIRGLPIRDTLSAGVALAVAAVPEGLPFLATAAQLSAARRLSARGALVRNPRTIETLGRVDVLGFDKTGTLTEGRIHLHAVSDGTHTAAVTEFGATHRRVLAAGLRATPRGKGKKKLPHPTDRAVQKGAAAAAVTREYGLAVWSPTASLPFEPGRGYHAAVGDAGTTTVLSVKGAPEVLLPRCARIRTADGTAPLNDRRRARLIQEHSRLAGAGYRVLAVADRDLGSAPRPADEELTDDSVAELAFLGFLVLSDPVRTTAGASLEALRAAGVQVLMMTGDHPATARTIATELGVLTDDQIMLTGVELEAMDDEALDAVLPRVAVIARSTPLHKVRVVEAYQRLGKTVAMTGDGANDAPAIRLADVGLALGRRGTPAARAAADVIVTDDQLNTIIDVLVEGRSMWASVRQALGIFVGGNLGEIAFTLLGSMATGRSPLSARQLLLVNLLTDLAPALAVALREPDPEATGQLLSEGPERSLGTALNREIAVRAVATTLAATGAWIIARLTGRRRHANTVGLAALVGSQLGQTLLVGGRSRTVLLSIAASAVVLAAIVQMPGVSQFFGCTPLGPAGWSIAIGASLAGTLLSFLLQASAGLQSAAGHLWVRAR